MAEQRKRGFHAFEKRVHELEEEDAKREQPAAGEGEAAKREAGKGSEERKEK